MKKEIQDLSWACLPKEAREEIKREYRKRVCGSYVEKLLQNLFGHHNLTSDTEPEEMLMKFHEKNKEK